VLRVLEINSMDALGLPDRAPGMWLSGAGLLIVAWGVAEILTERPREPWSAAPHSSRNSRTSCWKW
jgi:hypothetical protein